MLARCTRALKAAAGAEIVYVTIFGDGVPHLHAHLAPHRAGDALSDRMIRGEATEEKLPSGMTRITSHDFPRLPPEGARSRTGFGRVFLHPWPIFLSGIGGHILH
ncbi:MULTISPECIES: hypothetical protein [unclassified Inquilinus]|uniref:hypothetical protein n=1 Tax=unclassified Inquilinus TaxID=2645927 RepID=UPI003F91ED37